MRILGIHTAEGARTAASLAAYFYRDDVQASSHVCIDAGSTLQIVSYDRAAWTMRSANPVSENAEMCAFARWTRDQWLGTAAVDGCANPRAILSRTSAWIAARCAARGIPIRHLSLQQLAAGEWGVIAHADWTYAMHDGTHTDPGVGFPWDVVIADAAGGILQPPTPPPAGNPGRFAWSLPAGHYYGNIAGPAKSHGGYYASERDEVRNIQQWLIYKGCVSGVAPSAWASSGWADGRWENPTDAAMANFHARFYPHQPYPKQCWRDDYDVLTRP